MKNSYKFERVYMTIENVDYIVIRMKHYLFKDQWKDRCKVYQKKFKTKN